MNLTRLVAIFVGLLFLNGVLAGTASATTVVDPDAGSPSSERDGRSPAPVRPDKGPKRQRRKARRDLRDAGGRQERGCIQKLTDFVAQGYPSMGVQDVISCIKAMASPSSTAGTSLQSLRCAFSAAPILGCGRGQRGHKSVSQFVAEGTRSLSVRLELSRCGST